jgi:glycosyltransferase involved in cell wall biosynthesis
VDTDLPDTPCQSSRAGGNGMSAPLLSIILVTRNGAGTLPKVLHAIASQRTDFAFEIVAVDSGSTDGTVDLLERSVQRLVKIAAPAFNHGLTRNLAMEHAHGELAVFLVAGSARLHLICDRDAARAGRGSVGTWGALALAVAWPLGQYLGGLSAARGWKPIRFEGI